jgi:hypothetical protein
VKAAELLKLIRQESTIRGYVMVCVTALTVLSLVLAGRGSSLGALIPLLIGVLGLAIRWQSAPLLVLLAVIFTEMDLRRFWYGYFRPSQIGLEDLLLCAAMLAYVTANYRLQGLLIHIIPPAPRSRSRRAKLPPDIRRSLSLASSQEIAQLVLTLPIWVGLALVLWSLLPQQWNDLELPGHVWQTVLLIWLLALVVLVGVGLLSYLGRTRMTEAEAMLLLQDELWRQTRREQGRINRWLARALQRRKEKP